MASVLRSYRTGADCVGLEEKEISPERPSDVAVPLVVAREWPVSIGK